MKRVFWTGICNESRITGISRIQDSINKYGFILDYKFFSDISVSMVIESEERNVEKLYQELTKSISISNFEEFTSELNNPCTILLNITFTKDTGSLRIEVPAVPG